MSEKQATKKQLLIELRALKQRVSELEARETAWQRAEAALQESEDIYRKLFAASKDAIFLETLDGKVLDCNEAACEIYGYTREEFLRLNVTELVPPELVSKIAEGALDQLASGGIFLKTDNVRKNGRAFPVEVSTRLLTIQGEPRVVTFVRDITAQEDAEQSLKRRMQEFFAASEIAREIGTQGDLSKLLHTIIERAVDLLDAPMGCLYLVQPGGETIRQVVSYQMPEDTDGAVLKLGEGISGRVAQNGEIMMVDNYQDWPGKATVYAGSAFTCVLGVPLKIEQRVIGVIDIIDTRPRAPYSDHQINLINLFSDQAALAVYNAQLLGAAQNELAVRKRAEKVQQALYRISEATQTAESLQALFEVLHDTIEELMPARNFYIALHDPSTDLISYPYYADEIDAPPPAKKLGSQSDLGSRSDPGRGGLTDYVLQKGQPLWVTSEGYRQLVKSGEIEAIGAEPVDWMGVPLKIQKGQSAEQIGMMAVQSYTPTERYSKADQDVLAFVSTQVATAIERKRSEEALQHSAERYRLLFHEASVGILLINTQGTILEVNPTAVKILGSPSAQATKSINVLSFGPVIEAGFSANVVKCIETGQAVVDEAPYTSKWGKATQVHYYLSPIIDADGRVSMVQAILEDVTQRKLAEQEIQRLNRDLRRHAGDLSVLNRASQMIASTLDLERLYTLVTVQTQLLLDVETVVLLLIDPGAGENASNYIAAVSGGGARQGKDLYPSIETEIAAMVIQEQSSLLTADARRVPRLHNLTESWTATDIHAALASPLLARGKVLGVLEVFDHQEAVFDAHDQELLEALCSSTAIALENARLLDEANRRAEQLRLLYEAGIALNRTFDTREQMEAFVQIALRTLHTERCDFFRYNAAKDEVFFEFGIGKGTELTGLTRLHFPIGEQRGLIGWISQRRLPFYLPDVSRDPRWITIDPEIRSIYWVPIVREGRFMGLISVASYHLDAYSADDQRLLVLFANQVAVALDNTRLYQEAIDAAERRTTLHWLSQEIVSASLDPERIYSALYQAALKLMPVEVFLISLTDEAEQVTNNVYCIDRGVRKYPKLRLSREEGISGYIIRTGKPLVVEKATDLARLGIVPVGIGPPKKTDSILAVPMRLGERMLGMISVQSYRRKAYTEEDASLLEILAASAAIALENARIFAQMQTANLELAHAYEATIEGWSRALEMRDEETKGHSVRVTRSTVRLAAEVGVSGEALVHLRRGVLLHDIGKMAVPDHILLKPGPLTEDERQVMLQHPQFAHRMLSGIPFLEQALDIPYCHHENWDGTGYPRGLKGEEIPLGARIFALIDVWDALSADRPYRLAWTPEAVRSYILMQSGRRFDPDLVPVFLRLLDAGEFQAEGE